MSIKNRPVLRIGILTYHYVLNEGAAWQAVSLCRCIREKYPQHWCELIDYRHQGKYNSLRRLFPEAKQKLFDQALGDCLGATSIIANSTAGLFEYLSETYDLVIVGSDIIWQFEHSRSVWSRICRGMERNGSLRPDNTTPYRFLRDVKNWAMRLWAEVSKPDPMKIPFPNAYWLDPVGQYRKCTFAASVGYSDVENVSEALKPEIIRYLEALDIISVRDQASLRFVESLVPKQADITRFTPDPTWLFHDRPIDVDELFERQGLSKSDKLAGIQFQPHRFYGEKLNRWVLPLLKENGFKIVSVIDSNPNTDVDLAGETLHPFEWWAVISRLDFFFTIRTHPTIAALKYETPLANVDITAMLNRSKHSKSHDMLETFGLGDCCLHRRCDFRRNRIADLIEQCLKRPWDWDAVARQREVHQKTGLDTLSVIIGEAPNGCGNRT